MPRNGSGVAERPPNTNAVAGQTIESADFEASMNDIYSILNTPVPTAFLPSLATLGGVAKSGDTMTGLLTLSGNATANLHAVTKQQMDAALALKASSTHTHTASQVTDFNTAVTTRIAATSIDGLSDVTVTTPSVNQVLAWNGTAFVNTSAAGYELIETLTPSTSVALVACATFTKVYKQIQIVVTNLSSASAWFMTMAISSNGGSTYSTTQNFNASFGGGQNGHGVVNIFNTGITGAKIYHGGIDTDEGITSGAQIKIESSVTGVTNRLRIGVSAGNFRISPTIYIYGIL